jgi:hypothetical protein
MARNSRSKIFPFTKYGNIVTDVFAPVLTLKLVPAIKPHYLTDIPSATRGSKSAVIPTLALGSAISNSGPLLEAMMREVAEHVTAARVADAGHWVPGKSSSCGGGSPGFSIAPRCNPMTRLKAGILDVLEKRRFPATPSLSSKAPMPSPMRRCVR